MKHEFARRLAKRLWGIAAAGLFAVGLAGNAAVAETTLTVYTALEAEELEPLRQAFRVDLQTQSEWSYEGVAISGPMEGTELTRIAIDPGFWFEWVAFHPDTDLFGDVRN